MTRHSHRRLLRLGLVRLGDGAMNLVVMPFSIIAIRFIGEVFDRTGGYNPAFMVFIVTAVVSALLVLMVKPTRGSSDTIPTVVSAPGQR